MDRFHLLEHTADIGIEAIANRREGLAEQSGLAIKLLLFSDSVAEPVQAEEISADGNNPEETLVNWLNELLFLMADGKLVPAHIEVKHFTEKSISAWISGETFKPEKHQILREIKAVTHHRASIDHDDSFWKSTVYLDL